MALRLQCHVGRHQSDLPGRNLAELRDEPERLLDVRGRLRRGLRALTRPGDPARFGRFSARARRAMDGGVVVVELDEAGR
jgi:hypothetical protein